MEMLFALAFIVFITMTVTTLVVVYLQPNPEDNGDKELLDLSRQEATSWKRACESYERRDVNVRKIEMVVRSTALNEALSALYSVGSRSESEDIIRRLIKKADEELKKMEEK